MVATLIRTALSYFLLLAMVRLMGKRQIGELQMTEFISAVMLSEAAVFPITDRDIPLLYGLLPLIVISSIEVILALLCRKYTPVRHLLEGKPILLVENGQYKEENLTRTRISREEVDSQIRVFGLENVSQVEKVILEPTGQMSVLPKGGAQ
jgi:uncharacterized membrane protein YcaP (DUF421 family)